MILRNDLIALLQSERSAGRVLERFANKFHTTVSFPAQAGILSTRGKATEHRSPFSRGRQGLWCSVLFVVFTAGTAHADCTNPAGIEGEQVYNSTHKVMQYCDGTDWTAMRATGKADQSALNALTTTVHQKANQSALNSLSSTVSQKANQSALNALSSTVSGKADQSALNSLTSTVNGKVNKTGDTMTGALTLNGAPIANNQAATKAYVDTVAASGGGSGNYQMSCFLGQNQYGGTRPTCVRINISSGATECRWANGVDTSWSACSGSPW